METTLRVLGGIGLFLLGMSLLTEGVKAFAGDSLRRALVHFTGTPWKAFVSGAAATLLVQSSSATIVTVIGFVSAGLLTFPQALGVVFGASLGTTGTSWIVSLLGLKINLGTYSLPLLGLGAFLRMLARGRWSSLGTGVAGFAMIFLGIDTLQEGMKGLASTFNLAALPSQGLWGHLLALIIGSLMTVVMQSSSAAVATTLTALHENAVNFEQAASLVIGAAIGTTVTGALAAIGATIPAKRTALAHVLFNLATGIIALFMLPVFLILIEWLHSRMQWEGDATSLAAFHTAFIAVGIAVFLPIVSWFAGFIERALPDTGPQLTRHLDRTLRESPAVALEATRRALRDTAIALFEGLRSGLLDGHWNLRGAEIYRALQDIQGFLEQLSPRADDEAMTESRIAQMHAIDHLLRLRSRLKPTASIQSALRLRRLQPAVKICHESLELGIAGLQQQTSADWLKNLEANAQQLMNSRRQERPLILEQTAAGGPGPAEALDLLDGLRWLDRVGHHTWRTCVHLPRDASSAGD